MMRCQRVCYCRVCRASSPVQSSRLWITQTFNPLDSIFSFNPMESSRKRKQSNPLAAARGKHTVAEHIWHRKSGAGFQLFLEYYGSQPIGTVVSEPELPESTEKGPVTSNSQLRGKGQSRAAKRRKKKKKDSVESISFDGQARSDIHPPEQSFDTQNTQIVNAQLLEAFQNSSKQRFTHMKPLVDVLCRPLPLTFRIRQSATKREDLRQRVDKEFPFVDQATIGKNDIYQTYFPKSALSSHPEFEEFLQTGTSNGTLARQELASMLPVLITPITKGYRVLDMCASPGSKALQALEMVGESGRVYANDVSSSRVQALQEAVARSGIAESLTNRLRYTTQDARHYKSVSKRAFHVILVDVPCSGDGTIRKDKHILPLWTPATALALHTTQLEILKRGLQMLSSDAILCYSTCSLNPIEDEAVVAAAMTDDFELVGIETENIGVTLRPGLTDWKVAIDEGETDEDEVPRLTWIRRTEANYQVPVTVWPDPIVNKRIRIESCARLLPQDQNTGGFFLALIRRKSKLG